MREKRFLRGAATGIALLMLVMVVVSAFAAGGCAERPAPSNGGPRAAAVTVVDDTGTTVTLSAPARRVVSLAPSNTEIVFALGMGDAVVGVSSFCDYPAAARRREKVGDFFNPNVERILALEPDLVLAASGVQANAVQTLVNAGIPVAVFDPKSLAEVAEDFRKIGTLLGRRREGERLAARLLDEAERLRGQAKLRPRVFFEISNQPLMSAGRATFISDALGVVGATNLGDDFGEGWVTVSAEELVKRDPEVYLVATALGETTAAIAARPGFGSLSCARSGRIFTVTDDLVMRPGPRLVDGLRELFELVQGVEPE